MRWFLIGFENAWKFLFFFFFQILVQRIPHSLIWEHRFQFKKLTQYGIGNCSKRNSFIHPNGLTYLTEILNSRSWKNAPSCDPFTLLNKPEITNTSLFWLVHGRYTVKYICQIIALNLWCMMKTSSLPYLQNEWWCYQARFPGYIRTDSVNIITHTGHRSIRFFGNQSYVNTESIIMLYLLAGTCCLFRSPQ